MWFRPNSKYLSEPFFANVAVGKASVVKLHAMLMLNPKVSAVHWKFIHTQTNIQLKGVGLFKYVRLFAGVKMCVGRDLNKSGGLMFIKSRVSQWPEV